MRTQRIPLFVLSAFALASTAPAQQTWTIDSQEEWQANAAESDSLEFEGGMASPTAEQATYRSKLKTFREKRSPQSLVIDQSPVWDNWAPIANIGPVNLGDAPVCLSLGPDNYWMFGRYSLGARRAQQAGNAFESEEASLGGFDTPLRTTRFPNQYDAPGGLQKPLGGYHAWQSRDMVNWVHHGPITERVGKWMTTAEFADGKAYFYYDFPNDQDPHLYIDEDLTDGKPGKNMGLAFKDPTHGSDCGFIRSLDGAFHVIIEDWSPINAKTHAWDSPLASHAVSADGIGGFTILAPPVDERTSPTGKTGTYTHPHWAVEDPKNYPTNVAEYEIHEPEQNAYGDWAAIAIGGRYYLFCDFDPAQGQHMSVGRFTAAGIDEPFEWCGQLGQGHPDPDVMFAEGRFYLATQQKQDFVSPGPWVERVEARAGVDTDNDGSIDEWTDWRPVKEGYDYTPGFAKQVAKTPARLDLTGLPAGHGFAFEVRLTDTTQNASKPILDKVTLSFTE
ncbi:Glycosyl hydrolases family 43 [Pirellulimonas nuda]|uniref:Glycosyl hydrolases family 43 n=1 Tax=Pirellulimonas nuda TaxID=2528009 RepID=A0A518D8W3_9BACT|nr:hypothetical protein [Pirellulimonas nuda]QDU87913.1 Glycosyl hydrolases family 43 [Pirellulimonas nuda]